MLIIIGLKNSKKVVEKYEYTIKKILAISMCAALVGSTAVTLPVFVPESTITASAAETSGNYEYEINSDDTVTITKYNGTAKTLLLPSYLDGKKVTSIKGYAFNGSSVVTVTIPSTYTSIPGYSFYGASKMETINLPSSITGIGRYAFEFCTSLKTINSTGSVKTIGMGAFYGCTALDKFPFNDGVRTIGKNAFTNTALTSADIPESVTSISEHAFGYKYANSTYTPVNNFVIRGEIGSTAEKYASDNSFTFEPFLSYGIRDDNSAYITGYSGLRTELVIPSEIYGHTVAGIQDNAFENNETLTKVTLPDTATYIGYEAFDCCEELSEVVFGNSIETIEKYAFYACKKLESITLPDSVQTIGKCAFYDCEKLSSVSLGNSLISIGKFAFEDTPLLKGVTLPDTVETIEDYALGSTDKNGGDDEYLPDFTITASKSSVGEKYANDNGLTFIDNSPVVEVTKIRLSSTALTLQKGKTAALTATITPADATDKTLTWYTSDKTVATVKDGTVTAVGKGSCTVYAKSSNGKKGSCTVTVTETAPLVNTSVINSDIVQIGDKVRIAASANGGKSPYTYAYYYKRTTNTSWKTLGTEWGTTSSVAFAPTAEAEYDIKVIVKDSEGTTSEKLFTVKAVKELELTNVSVVGRTSINLGTAIPMVGKAVGGKGEPYTYSFYFKRSANTNWKLLGEKFQTTASARFKPTATGTYDIRIDVKDSSGTIVKKFFTATVK